MFASAELPPPEIHQQSRPPRRAGRIYGLLFLAYAVFVTYGSLVPLNYHYVPFADALDQVLANPIDELAVRNMVFGDVQIHVLLFLPLTFLGMGFVTRANAAAGRFALALALLAMACLLSVAVEIGQVYSPPRTACLGHWAYQCVGALLGIVAWFLLGSTITRWVCEAWSVSHPLPVAIYTLTAYTVTLLAYTLLPLDVPTSWAAYFDKLDRVAWNLNPLAEHVGLKHIIGKIGQMIPVGYLFSQLGRRGFTVGAATALGVLFVLAVSFLGLSVSSDNWSSADVLLAVVGVGVGAWLADRFGPRASKGMADRPGWILLGRLFGQAGFIAGAAAVAHNRLQPFDFTMPPQGLWAHFLDSLQIPFFYQYHQNSFAAMRDMLLEFGAFLVLGLLLRSVTSMIASRSRFLPAILIALLAIAMEEGRLLLPDRIADATAAMIGAVGGVVGALLYPTFLQVYIRTPPRQLPEKQDRTRLGGNAQ